MKGKTDPGLLRELAGLAVGETAQVLVYPAGPLRALAAHLTERGDLPFTVLGLAGCVAVDADLAAVSELADRPEVARIASSPVVTSDGDDRHGRKSP